MIAKNGVRKPVFRVHAFDVTWAEVPPFPRDYRSADQVLLMLNVWEKNRYLELVLGKEPQLFPELQGVVVIEMEVYYE